MEPFTGITWPDYVIITLYFIFVLAVGLFVSFQNFLFTPKKCFSTIFVSRHLYWVISVFDNAIEQRK
jgi:hypothetical protein